MTLSPQFLDQLRTRTTLSALIGKTVKLQRAGNEYRACCPFHTEKTPSFCVNDDKAFYHCFGCGAHGDAIRWLTDSQGLPFLDAVRELADAAGMDMPAQEASTIRNAERAKGLHDAVADAQRWFANRLADAGGSARAALSARGITPDTARDFGLGFAPASRGRLRATLAGYGDAMLIDAGLLISIDGKEPYDRFRRRLMIPIRDARGRTIAFGGRIIGEGEPKYLNSPETPLFAKGRTLFNIDRAPAAARKAGRLIAVEGYLDVITLAQAGIAEVVAPLGTALTEDQFALLWRIVDCPILCFDGDEAGIRAARRTAKRALPLLQPGKSIAIVRLPDSMDPDDLVRVQGVGAFEAALHDRQPLADFVADAVLADYPTTAGPDDRAAARHRCDELATTIAHPGIAREYARTLRDRCWRHFNRSAPARPAPRPATDPTAALHHAVLVGLTRNPGILNAHCESVAALPITRPDLIAWRDELVDATISGTALPASPVPTPPLAFTFCRVASDEAAEELLRAIDVLLTEDRTRRALRDAVDRAAHDDAALADVRRLSADRSAIGRLYPED